MPRKRTLITSGRIKANGVTVFHCIALLHTLKYGNVEHRLLREKYFDVWDGIKQRR